MWTVQWALKSYWYGRGLQLAGGNFFQREFFYFWRKFPRQMLQYVTMWAATSPSELTTKENARLARNYWFQAIPLQKLLKVYSKSIKSCSKWQTVGGTCRASAFCFATTVFAMQFFSMLWHRMIKNMKKAVDIEQCTCCIYERFYCSPRMQADSVILPISNVAQTTQTLSSLSGRF